MSGFLQRLASTVLNPRSAVHPMPGSLFQGSGGLAGMDGHDRQTEITSPAAPIQPPTSSFTEMAHDSSREIFGEERPSELFANRPPSVLDQQPPFQPLIEVSSRREIDTEPGETEKAASRATTDSSVPEQARSPEGQPLVIRPPVHPVLPADSRASEPDLDRRRTEKSAAKESPGRATRIQREADEIQINIGRIEVTAVPQTPTKPSPPRSNRKVLSLDDYLKRTDRGRL